MKYSLLVKPKHSIVGLGVEPVTGDLDHYITRIRERLVEAVSSGREPVDRIVLQSVQRPGKMIRPRLVLQCGALFGGTDQRTIDVAAAIECIHIASLVHDDIVDEACLRRGIPTINCLFDTQTAVLAGDHLFATAFEILAYHRLNDIISEVTRAIRQMCAGEISQDLNLFNFNLSESDYLTHIFGKTASLFGAACRCGALVAGSSSGEAELAGRFGEYLGYAYQIADDVMDFCGDEAVLGKPCGGDLKHGVITLPVIKALAVPEIRHELTVVIKAGQSGSDTTRIIEMLRESGAIQYAVLQAVEYCLKARRVLHYFPPSKARQQLTNLCSSLIKLPVTANTWREHTYMEIPAEVDLCRLEPESPGSAIT